MITLDFETYWSQTYTLSKMPTEAYVRHPDYQTHLVGIKIDDQPAIYLPDSQFRKALGMGLRAKIQSEPLLIQNAIFDGLILSHHYGTVPAFYLDTMSMFRSIYPDESASLANMARRLGLHKDKGSEVLQTRNKRTKDFTPQELHRLGLYCIDDCELTYEAYNRLKALVPVMEYRLIDLTVRWFTQPALLLNSEPLQAEHEEEVARKAALLQRLGGDPDKAKKMLMSNPQFAALLEARGVRPPIKASPSKLKTNPELQKALDNLIMPQEDWTPEVFASLEPPVPWSYAFGKSDAAMKALLQHPDPEVQLLTEVRLGVKSSISETRAARMLDTAARGPVPMALRYAGAHTLRWSGCVVAQTEILVYDWSIKAPTIKRIVDVMPDDLVWDGEAFVQHGGVKFQGYKEVISHDGITGTPDHHVYTDENTTITLAEAKRTGTPIMVAADPEGWVVDHHKRNTSEQ